MGKQGGIATNAEKGVMNTNCGCAMNAKWAAIDVQDATNANRGGGEVQ
jgi:hypothetical protein